VREVVLRVRREAAEEMLDRLLPIVHGGVREARRGRKVELLMRGSDVPAVDELARVTGRPRSQFIERQISDDWRERRRGDYEPMLIANRLVVRPRWAPRSRAEIEISLTGGVAFGAGTHPTTRTCLEVLLGLSPAGSFADLGCGTGVLAILAARLGWNPVLAIDVSSRSVEATRANARANHVSLQARKLDLEASPPPPTDCLAANVGPPVHLRIACLLPQPTPRLGLMSGFHPSEAGQVADAYASCGLRVRRQLDREGWSILLLES
jgi:ribosomal protein L11 methyltransferase